MQFFPRRSAASAGQKASVRLEKRYDVDGSVHIVVLLSCVGGRACGRASGKLQSLPANGCDDWS